MTTNGGHVLGVAVGMAMILGVGCATAPPPAPKAMVALSAEEEIALGEAHFARVQQNAGGQVPADPALSAYISKVGWSLAILSDRPELPWEFVVVNSSIPNTWSLPGGKVAVTRGLLTPLSSEVELAYLLAHEIAHVSNHDGALALARGDLVHAGAARMGADIMDRGMSALVPGESTLGVALISHHHHIPDEIAADRLAIELLIKAGYDPEPVVRMHEAFLSLSRAGWQDWNDGLLHIHPPSPERLDACRRAIAKAPHGGRVGQVPYQTNMALLQARQAAYDAHGDGVLALMAGDVDKSLRLAAKAIAMAPEVPDFYALKGMVQMRLKRYVEADRSFSEALQRSPGHYHYLLLRGLVRKGLGDTEGAIRDLTASTDVRPTRIGHQVLGALYLEHNQRSLAWQHFMRATGGQHHPAGPVQTGL